MKGELFCFLSAFLFAFASGCTDSNQNGHSAQVFGNDMVSITETADPEERSTAEGPQSLQMNNYPLEEVLSKLMKVNLVLEPANRQARKAYDYRFDHAVLSRLGTDSLLNSLGLRANQSIQLLNGQAVSMIDCRTLADRSYPAPAGVTKSVHQSPDSLSVVGTPAYIVDKLSTWAELDLFLDTEQFDSTCLNRIFSLRFHRAVPVPEQLSAFGLNSRDAQFNDTTLVIDASGFLE